MFCVFCVCVSVLMTITFGLVSTAMLVIASLAFIECVARIVNVMPMVTFGRCIFCEYSAGLLETQCMCQPIITVDVIVVGIVDGLH